MWILRRFSKDGFSAQFLTQRFSRGFSKVSKILRLEIFTQFFPKIFPQFLGTLKFGLFKNFR